MIIVPGIASINLSKKLAKIMNAKIANLEYKIFPDGESYIRIVDDVKDDVVIVNSTYPNQDKRLIELFLLIDNLKDLGAKKIKVVVPYIAYARQDMRFREGEVISINTILKLIEKIGADEFITIDIHKEHSLNTIKIKAKNLNAIEVIADYLKNISFNEPYVLAPDKGALERAKKLGEIMKCEYGYFEKYRDRISGAIRIEGIDIDFKDRDVIIVDDVISTGGTIANTAKIVKEKGAKRIIAICTHALLIKDALEKMKNAGVDEIISTDTVENEFSKITVAPLIARELC
ncbi:MAG: ribose-phosphate diphosphokinase [Candidatus Methanomethylicia archaeon]|jgi:ribose-phosphate pyrophosphokinase|nr:ribose-phosphate diphosphokinase [Candidatus Methanomethylicia archaeon]MCQ5340413.1 ribose-phosphate diphosphokinase [Candidatus Methanomethylicia archaeon]